MMHKSQAVRKYESAQEPAKIIVKKELAKLNSHINFSKEGEKSSARKTPTGVTCCKCKTKFTLPFKPRNPEVYCDSCFKEKKKGFGKKMQLQRPNYSKSVK